ncbi:DUF6266 family protein [Parapedobacter soli]|uniref:DUF6266 family protein n=1 Tax=Parapedobacter soli TaxID=416955 RepID=UPI0021C72F99|nr:DUF6266 family protein [Parapedobacter soli]
MAVFKKGINGAFSGTIGNTVGSSWRHIDYMRSLPKPSKKPASPAQLAQRAKFALAVSFLRSIKPLLNLGFSDKMRGKQTGYNQALKVMIANAIVGEYPDFTIDYANVVLAQGGLNPAPSAVLEQTAPGQLALSWEPITNKYTSFADDEAVVVVYNVSKRFMNVYDGIERSVGSMDIAVPSSFEGDELVAWVFMVHRDGEKTSDSVFAGTLVLAGETEPDPEP